MQIVFAAYECINVYNRTSIDSAQNWKLKFNIDVHT